MSFMGLDIGQTGCRAIVFDEEGAQRAVSYREYETLSPRRGWAELDSARVVERAFEVMREANGQTADDPVRTLAVSSQGEAFTPVDGGGELIGNAMITFDTRSAGIMKSFSEEYGARRLYQTTGHTAHPMFSLFKLLWVRDNRPDLFGAADKFLCFEDLIHHSLGLHPHIAWSLAGRTMMFDIKKHRWDGDILGAVGINGERLAVPAPSGTTVGAIPRSIASSLGFQKEVTVLVGGHDQPLGALGAGVIEPGKAMYATGTSEAITPAFPEPILSDDLFRYNICTYDYTVAGMYTTVVFSLTGGNILKWFRDEWGHREQAEAEKTKRDIYEVLLDSIGDRPSPVLVLPYFTPSGTPYFDSEVSGAIFGLHLSTKREEVLRALLEGVAFEMRLNLDIMEGAGIPIEELRAIGGGAKSPLWVQLKADVLDTPITRVAVTEAAGYACAMIGCAALTGEPLEELAKKWVKTEGVITPDPENAGSYRERFETYRKLYPALKELNIS